MDPPDITSRLLSKGVVAIIRADDSEQLVDACEALVEGGVNAIEVTMTTPDALGVIERASKRLAGAACLGVGSVLDDVTARLAILAGAEYVVTPVMRPDVIALCRRYSRPVCCGAYTPTEALAAHEAGADLVKIFPADGLGPGYIKAILGPLPQLRIVPTGGVSVESCGAFIKAGCVAVAAGGSLVSREILQKRDWAELTRRAAAFVAAVADARGGK